MDKPRCVHRESAARARQRREVTNTFGSWGERAVRLGNPGREASATSTALGGAGEPGRNQNRTEPSQISGPFVREYLPTQAKDACVGHPRYLGHPPGSEELAAWAASGRRSLSGPDVAGETTWCVTVPGTCGALKPGPGTLAGVCSSASAGAGPGTDGGDENSGPVPSTPPGQGSCTAGPAVPFPASLPWDHFTDYPVYHDVFFYNPDVRKFVVKTLTGKTLGPEPVITFEELLGLSDFGLVDFKPRRDQL